MKKQMMIVIGLCALAFGAHAQQYDITLDITQGATNINMSGSLYYNPLGTNLCSSGLCIGGTPEFSAISVNDPNGGYFTQAVGNITPGETAPALTLVNTQNADRINFQFQGWGGVQQAVASQYSATVAGTTYICGQAGTACSTAFDQDGSQFLPGLKQAPEIDPNSAASAIILLLLALTILTSYRKPS